MTDAGRKMRAMLAPSTDPASLAYQAIQVPDPGPGELLVQVRATAVTAGELDWPETWPAIPVGGEVMTRSWPVLRPGGTLVAIAEPPDDKAPGRPDTTGVYFVVEPNSTQLRELARQIDNHQLRPLVADTLELTALPPAFGAQRQRRAPGKIVISLASTAT